jgi:hypothetical protein
MPEKSRLMPISYYNPKQEIRLSAYADTLILEPDGREQRLRAIRFGGYPEMVRAMADAIYAGATLEAEIAGEAATLSCEPKKYECHLSHDGIYAEATILSLDDEDTAAKKDEEAQADGQTNVELPPRKCVLFCPAGDRRALFEALDRKTAVPLIPEFQDYVLDELQRRRFLKPLRVISIRERLEAWLLLCKKDDANIVKVLEEGLKTGAIHIPGTVQAPHGFDDVHSVTSYLSAFGVTVAERIREQFQPLFDPAAEQLSPEVLRINDYIRAHAGYSLYPAQLAVAESVKRKLSEGKSAFIVAECGSGKTKIGATALAAYQAQKRKKTFNIILCPSHVAKKWVREIAETLPDTVGVIVRSIAELDSLYAQYRQGDKSICAVISKEKARDGYMRRPAVLFDARKGAFRCPSCGEIIELPSSDEEDGWTTAKPEAFRMENRRNHQCMSCDGPLWTAVNPSVPSPWVKIPEYGWVHRKLAVHAMQKTKNPAALDALLSLHENPDGYFPTRGACRRYPLSSYIKKRYRGRLDGLIVDELHEYNNDSGQGDAMAELFGTAKKVIGMTATLINGYSSGIFHLLYRTSAQLMLADGKPHEKPALFNTEYGVVETTYTEADERYAAKRRSQKSGVRTRQLPGVSPLVFSRFLLEKTAFLSLSDMGKALPSYEEIPIACEMDEAVEMEYKRIEHTAELDAKLQEFHAKLGARSSEVYQPKYTGPLAEDTAKVQALGKRYQQNAALLKRFQPGTSCPVCRRVLSQQEYPAFRQALQVETEKIAADGTQMKGQIAELQEMEQKSQSTFEQFKADDLVRYQSEIDALNQKREQLQAAAAQQNTRRQQTLEQLRTRIQNLTASIECGTLSPADSERLAECKASLEDCRVQLAAAQQVLSAAPEDFDERIHKIEQEITEKKIVMKDVILYMSKRAEMIFSKLALNRVKISLYDVVKTTGELKDVFRFTYNGRRYDRLSLSEKIRAGAEVSELVKRLTGRNYPVFFDNMESVDDLSNIRPTSQMILAKCVRNAELSVRAGSTEMPKAA